MKSGENTKKTGKIIWFQEIELSCFGRIFGMYDKKR